MTYEDSIFKMFPKVVHELRKYGKILLYDPSNKTFTIYKSELLNKVVTLEELKEIESNLTPKYTL